MRSALLAASLVLGAFLAAASSTSALAYSVSYDADISLSSPDGSSTFLTISTGPLTESSVSRSFSQSAEFASLALSGTASLGRLTGTSSTGVEDAYDYSEARGAQTMSFSDTITVTGAPGTMVNFLATLRMTSVADAFGFGAPCFSNSASAGSSVAVGTGSLSINNSGGCFPTDSSPKTLAFQALAGSSFPVSADLFVFAHSTGQVHAFAFADATMIFNLDAQTPGASYLTESGVSYALQVPEPGTLVLTAIGLAGLLGRRRATMKGLG
jgi:hypothetical protein